MQFYRKYMVEELTGARSDDAGPLTTLAEQLGHTAVSSTLKYYRSTGQNERPDPEEMASVLAAAAALFAGMRVGEVCSLKLDDVGLSLRETTIGKCHQPAVDAQKSYACRNSLVSWDSSGWELSLPCATAPSVPGLTRQYHELDRTGALTAHLNALDEQLAPEHPRKSRKRG